MPKVILIAKVGGVLHTREEQAHRAGALGEQGDTEGVVRHLAERAVRGDIRLVYYGQWRGRTPDGCELLQPTVDGLNDNTTAAQQHERFMLDAKRLDDMLGPDEPVAFVNIAGYAPTSSLVANPQYATVQAASVRYVAPAVDCIARWRLKRIVINNDLRTYTRDQEMTWHSEHLVPVALLDQTSEPTEYKTTIGGRKYLRRSVYSKAEGWAYHLPCSFMGEQQDNTDETPVTLIAHCHVHTGFKEPGRDQSFWRLLSDGQGWAVDPELLQLGLRVHGAGWEHYSGYDPAVMTGSITPREVYDVLWKSTCCPCVAPGKGWVTSKPYVLMSQGCIPILFGDGEDDFTWDRVGDYAPLRDFDDYKRASWPGELARIAKALQANDHLRWELREWWRERLQPDFTLLDSLIDDVLDSRPISWERYGGWRPI
jgi:hypothetical protein